MYISEEELLSRTLIILVPAIDTTATITISNRVFLDALNALKIETIRSFQFKLESCERFHVAPWYPWLVFIIIAYVLGDEILKAHYWCYSILHLYEINIMSTAFCQKMTKQCTLVFAEYSYIVVVSLIIDEPFIYI